MADPNSAKQAAMEDAAIKSIASASLLVRQAVMEALPVAPEQYLTLTVPGTVIDTTDLSDGGTFVWDGKTLPFAPTAVQQAEARLVDGMMPLASVMLGNTGKSVSRSYATALDFLVPKKATVSTQNQIRSPGEKSYDDAMKYLSTKDQSGYTPVDIYILKQLAWAKAQDAWDTAKITAKQDAQKQFPNDVARAQQAFNDWAQQHYRRFKNEVQARWIDWVTNGNKYNVEYNFGLVDIDSIMARIESSKQAMRNSVIVDADGANELQEVFLTPKNWATLCKNKADGFYTRNGLYSPEQLSTEIARLKKFRVSLSTLKAEITAGKYPKSPAPTAPTETEEDADKKLGAAYQALYDAQGAATPGSPSAALNDARQKLGAAIQEWDDWADKKLKFDLSTGANAGWIDTIIATVTGQIDQLTHKLGNTQTAYSIAPVIGAHAPPAAGADGGGGATAPPEGNALGTSGNDEATAGNEMANPIFGIGAEGTTTGPPPADPWTKITASYSATDQKTLATTSSWGFSVGASVSWGLWSAGGSYSHDESSSSFQSDIANCDVKVSFSALVVNINRPWLYGELFNDFEIDVATDVHLSPGPQDLHALMDKQHQGKDDLDSIKSLALYNTFPAYPTSFIVASDAELEFVGDTKHVEQHFKSVSNSASAHFGWGPFSIGGSYHSSSTRADYQMHATATGFKISFAAPQVIAWVSEILPALPRKPGFEPIVQNYVS